MWTVQKENNKLLEAEARELANVLNDTLFSVVNKADDIKQATELLLSTGLINQKAVRNMAVINDYHIMSCLLYTSPSPRDRTRSRMPSSA